VAERLEVPETSWDNARNVWFSSDEKADYKAPMGSLEAPANQLEDLSDINCKSRNKSIFVSPVPRDEKFLSVCAIINVYEGEFLGAFAGRI
jgi:hypothetical protein